MPKIWRFGNKVLPKAMVAIWERCDPKAALEKAGVCFLGTWEEDREFYRVKLPKGWKVWVAKAGVLYLLVDARKRSRAEIGDNSAISLDLPKFTLTVLSR